MHLSPGEQRAKPGTKPRNEPARANTSSETHDGDLESGAGRLPLLAHTCLLPPVTAGAWLVGSASCARRISSTSNRAASIAAQE